MSAPVLLILGAGARVGRSSAQAFQAIGYRVVIASRSLEHGKTNSSGFLELQVDLSEPEQIPNAFAIAEQSLGAPPSVVIYNGASRTTLPSKDPLSEVELANVNTDLNINFVSPIAAAKQAVAGFAKLPESASKTFIFTGNGLNVFPNPLVMTFGAAKSATAHAIEALTKAYPGKGYRFYYADQRWEDGASPLNSIDGEAHGKEYVELARDRNQRPWDYTFVKGLGYKAFTPADMGNTKWPQL